MPKRRRKQPKKAKAPKNKLLRAVKGLCLTCSALLWLFVLACYSLQPDYCAVLTIWPPWIWLLPGLGMLILGWMRVARRPAVVLLLLWLGFAGLFSEEPRSLIRSFSKPKTQEWQLARLKGQALRVISFNCVSKEGIAAEVAKYQPDIVLLQESPKKKETEALARQLFGAEGSYLWSHDESIIVHGSIMAVPPESPGDFVHGDAVLISGQEVEIVNTHIYSRIYNFKFWTKEAWRDQALTRQKQMEQAQKVAARLKTVQTGRPLILGGDFNAPHGDKVFGLFRGRLTDAFNKAGVGWGNTFSNHHPLVRIDQLWLDDHFRPLSVRAQRSERSDHRMVICDLIIKEPGRQLTTSLPTGRTKRSKPAR